MAGKVVQALWSARNIGFLILLSGVTSCTENPVQYGGDGGGAVEVAVADPLLGWDNGHVDSAISYYITGLRSAADDRRVMWQCVSIVEGLLRSEIDDRLRQEDTSGAIALAERVFYAEWFLCLASVLSPDVQELPPDGLPPGLFLILQKHTERHLSKIRTFAAAHPKRYDEQWFRRFDRLVVMRETELDFLKAVLTRLGVSVDAEESPGAEAEKEEEQAVDPLPPVGVPSGPRGPGGE